MNRHRRPDRYATYRRRAWIVGCVALTVAALVSIPAIADAQTAGDGTRGCVVKLYDAGPQILDNAAHACTALSGVSKTADGNLRVNIIQTGSRIEVFDVDADEQGAPKGLDCGASVGLTSATIRCGLNGRWVPITDDRITCTQCNLWFTVKQTGTFQ